MGRRSQHKPDELRKLIIDAAQRIVENGGVAQLSAREIAREIGYAPGTLYNMYQNLDEILLRVQVRMLERLDETLASDMDGSTGADAITCFATSYVAFAHRHPRLWGLLVEHNLLTGVAPPSWYLEWIDGLHVRLEAPLASLLRTSDAKTIAQTARSLWTAIHGMTVISTSAKHGMQDVGLATLQVLDIVETVLGGLASRAARRGAPAHAFKDRPSAAG